VSANANLIVELVDIYEGEVFQC